MEPQIRFCTSADGTRIAYATVGEGPPLLLVLGFGHSLQLDWEHPVSRSWLERLASERQVAAFDRRGVGASQREVEDLSLQAQLADVTAVVEELEWDRFDLFGSQDGTTACVLYAANYPGRVSRLVLWMPAARGWAGADQRAWRSFVELVRGNWPVARRAMADVFLPTGPTELQRWLSRYWQQAFTPEVLARYFEESGGFDVRLQLPRVQAPTLIFHRAHHRHVPVDAGREVAALIPDARFVVLEGDMGLQYHGDISYVETMTRFLDEGAVAEPPAERSEPGAFRTILFTDVEGSTALTQRLGDARARELLREHERTVREALKAHGGSEVKTMGDGFMASFSSATRALACAVAIQRAFAVGAGLAPPLGAASSAPTEAIRVRIGLNAGEPIAEGEDLFGTAVNLAARIAGSAQGGEILVANVVRELAAGKGFLFADRGEAALRGFENPVRLYEVRWWEQGS